ncbi:hypothetical protein CQ10_21580 [Bradyrhizobium valentinum]|uniref:Uncharacterized protein n=1 Tax=Bradyrhizobium valentinum TaxID=1518501 RepID=A0A0R3LHS3_9BRAD|nr:hypothetical protein CQ10_21580 [Bradyrhizobium valentinum]KRR05455.1 hypothetical protein CP49_02915 [Bradyrhizobium valentinum]
MSLSLLGIASSKARSLVSAQHQRLPTIRTAAVRTIADHDHQDIGVTGSGDETRQMMGRAWMK